MFKPKFLIAAIAGLLFFTKVNAQTDTSYYDLGRTLLKKDFTQSITVKGADLEKMPFDNLAEAINVWFYGSYTTVPNLVYIIDGNLANDVNAYSIYDIDEVTLIQNAVAQINGSTQQQQLVLIKTKRPKNKGYGVTANAKADISSLYTNNILNPQTDNSYETGQKSTTTVYQQYNISAYGNAGNMQFGVSANYLVDALPMIKSPDLSGSPESFDRPRFNGYFDVKFGNSVLDITAGYAPQGEKQDVDNNYTYDIVDAAYKQTDHLFNGSIKLTTQILPGLTNVLHGDYNYYKENSEEAEAILYQEGSMTTDDILSKYTQADHDIVAYDNLSYTMTLRDWSLEPALNLSFRTFRDSINSNSFSDESDNEVETSNYYEAANQHMFLLTPSVNFYYKTWFNVEVGVLYNMTLIGVYANPTVKEKKVFPFVTASADVMHLIDPASTLAIKVFGSYSMLDHIADNYNPLPDFSNTSYQVPLVGTVNNSQTEPYDGYGSIGNVNYAADVQSSTKSFYTISAGLTLAPKNSGFSFNYYFDKRTYLGIIYEYAPYGANGEEVIDALTDINSTLNRVGVDYDLFKGSLFSWRAGINGTTIKQVYFPFANGNYPGANPVEGAGTWTGGWVNRLTYRSFFAGADLLYEFDGKTYTPTTSGYYGDLVTHSVNSFSLQNLYVGYRIKVNKLRGLDVFANARNLFQNQKEIITDDRKYYGLGVDLSL